MRSQKCPENVNFILKLKYVFLKYTEINKFITRFVLYYTTKLNYYKHNLIIPKCAARVT